MYSNQFDNLVNICEKTYLRKLKDTSTAATQAANTSKVLRDVQVKLRVSRARQKKAEDEVQEREGEYNRLKAIYENGMYMYHLSSRNDFPFYCLFPFDFTQMMNIDRVSWLPCLTSLRTYLSIPPPTTDKDENGRLKTEVDSLSAELDDAKENVVERNKQIEECKLLRLLFVFFPSSKVGLLQGCVN